MGDYVYPYPRLAKGDPKRAETVGGFSECVLIPRAKLGREVYAVSTQNISLKTACLIKPFTVGFRAARRSFPNKGENRLFLGQEQSVLQQLLV